MCHQNSLDEHWLFSEWTLGLKQELADWQDELGKLESKIPDGRLIYNNASVRVLQTLESVAREIGLFPHTPRREAPVQRSVTQNLNLAQADMKGWVSLVKLGEWGNIDPSGGSSVKPRAFRDSSESEMPVRSWTDLLFQVADWLAKKGFIAKANCPITIGGRGYLIHTEPVNARGTNFHAPKELSNGLYLETNINGKGVARTSRQLLAELGYDPTQFHVLLE